MVRVYQHKRLASFLFFSALILLIILASSSRSRAQDISINANSLEPQSTHTADSSKPLEAGRPQLSLPNSFEEVTPLQPVSIIITYDGSLQMDQLLLTSQGQVTHQYSTFNGAALVVTGNKIDAVANMPGITAVYLDQLNQPTTDNSIDFIGAPTAWNSLGGPSNAGEGTLFASLDSGVWPEHPSFSDPDGFGNGYAAPAGGPYPCEFGNSGWNADDVAFSCNNKLIGAYQFLETYKMLVGLTPEEFDSARDDDGHGTHTTTTAAGNGGVSASIAGSDLGHVSGVAPRAQVIAYKVCGAQGCFSSDALAAIEQAIADDVDVINYSISGGVNPYTDIVSLGFLRAYDSGIFVAKSAGNSGPDADTVAGRSPWVTTVGASTQDRTFSGTLALTSGDNELTLTGSSLTGPHTGEVVLAADFDGIPADDPNDGQCLSPFPADTWTQGEIVVCKRGQIARVTKGYNALQGGAGGYVLYNPTPNSLVADNHFLPTVHLQDDAGAALLEFLANNTAVMGSIEGGIKESSQANVMAAFSSRGGTGQTLGVSKPDITAPGVQILAGHTAAPSSVAGGAPGQLFQVIQGTSMSAPHVAGSALLLAQMNPDWGPGQIKSALMTTAYSEDLVKEDGVTPVDNFDAGSGHIDLTQAGNPGISISDSGSDYLALEDELWNSNYPSLYIPSMPGRMTIERTIRSELDYSAFWEMHVEAPSDLRVIARGQIGLRPGSEKTVSITIDARQVPLGEVRHATLYFKEVDGPHVARFPITIVREMPEVEIFNRCNPAVFVRTNSTECSITITNMSFDDAQVDLLNDMPRRLRLVENSVVGAETEGLKSLSYNGLLEGSDPPMIMVEDGTGTTAGYISLALFGIAPVSGVTDESIVNFSVPEYEYGGEMHDSIGMVSNGYLIVGGGTSADVDFVNQIFPDPTIPNNVLAPFWTDLNPSAGGNLYAAILGDSNSDNAWVVLEWAEVPNFSDGELNSFQVWIGINGEEDIAFVYGDVSDGDGGLLTVGAENEFGNSGANWYADGVGTAVTSTTELRITSIPGAPGASHQITFEVTGWTPGPWNNCVELTSDLFDGTNIICFSGEITP